MNEIKFLGKQTLKKYTDKILERIDEINAKIEYASNDDINAMLKELEITETNE